MKNMGNMLKNRFQKQKYARIIASALLGIFMFSLPLAAFAVEPSTEQKAQDAIAAAISFVHDVVQPITWLAVTFVGSLMDDSMIFGSGMEEILRAIWVQIRNLVNIMFVLILLAIALYNVFGRTEGNFVMKTVLPKFVIALILVNFSFFIGKVIIDVASAATTIVFSLPQQVYEPKAPMMCHKVTPDNPATQDNESQVYSYQCILPIKMLQYYKKQPPEVTPQEIPQTCKDGDSIYEFTNNDLITVQDCKKVTIDDFNKQSMSLILATNIMYLQDIPKQAAQGGDATTLSIESFFSLLFVLLYGTAFIAMMIVLIARVAILWFTLIFSPVIGIFYVMGDMLPPPEKFNIQKMFIEHAFVPVKMAIPITVGFIMIVQGRDILMTQTETGSMPLGNIVVKLDEVISGIGDMRLLLWNMTILATVWFGVFAAANQTVVSGMVESFKNIAFQAGKWVAQAPLLMPIIPAPMVQRLVQAAGGKPEDIGKGVSPLALFAGAQQALQFNTPSMKARGQAQQLFPNWFGGSQAAVASQEIRAAGGDVGKLSRAMSMNRTVISMPAAQQALGGELYDQSLNYARRADSAFNNIDVRIRGAVNYDQFVTALRSGIATPKLVEAFIDKFTAQNPQAAAPAAQPPASGKTVEKQTDPASNKVVSIQIKAGGNVETIDVHTLTNDDDKTKVYNIIHNANNAGLEPGVIQSVMQNTIQGTTFDQDKANDIVKLLVTIKNSSLQSGANLRVLEIGKLQDIANDYDQNPLPGTNFVINNNKLKSIQQTP